MFAFQIYDNPGGGYKETAKKFSREDAKSQFKMYLRYTVNSITSGLSQCIAFAILNMVAYSLYRFPIVAYANETGVNFRIKHGYRVSLV